MIEARPEWRDAVRLIGIGVGNSAYEVGFFKETYGIQFPLIPDGDFTVHNALGKPRTPYFLVIRIGDDRQSHLVYTHLGGFGDPEAFLDTAMTRAGMR
jgi:peroxiredoxin